MTKTSKNKATKTSVVRKKATLARPHSGGITVLVKNSPLTTMCYWSNPSCLTIRIKGSAFNDQQDIYVITVYLTAEHSSYLKSTQTNPFLLLSQTHNKIPKEAHTILMGHFNANTGQSNGATPHIHSDIIPHLQPDSQDIEPPNRKSLNTSSGKAQLHSM